MARSHHKYFYFFCFWALSEAVAICQCGRAVVNRLDRRNWLYRYFFFKLVFSPYASPQRIYNLWGYSTFFYRRFPFCFAGAGKVLKKLEGINNGGRPVLIIGAGDAGIMVAEELKKHQAMLGTRLVGFIDDDPNKQKQVIHGLPVLGTREIIPRVVEEKEIEEVIIAMPSASYSRQREIIELSKDLPVKLKTVPGVFEILGGKVSLSHLKKVEIEDL